MTHGNIKALTDEGYEDHREGQKQDQVTIRKRLLRWQLQTEWQALRRARRCRARR